MQSRRSRAQELRPHSYFCAARHKWLRTRATPPAAHRKHDECPFSLNLMPVPRDTDQDERVSGSDRLRGPDPVRHQIGRSTCGTRLRKTADRIWAGFTCSIRPGRNHQVPRNTGQIERSLAQVSATVDMDARSKIQATCAIASDGAAQLALSVNGKKLTAATRYEQPYPQRNRRDIRGDHLCHPDAHRGRFRGLYRRSAMNRRAGPSSCQRRAPPCPSIASCGSTC
jgi:hypothetical protein